jgi:hypothetical protein
VKTWLNAVTAAIVPSVILLGDLNQAAVDRSPGLEIPADLLAMPTA